MPHITHDSKVIKILDSIPFPAPNFTLNHQEESVQICFLKKLRTNQPESPEFNLHKALASAFYDPIF